jgi:hypothetical protein
MNGYGYDQGQHSYEQDYGVFGADDSYFPHPFESGPFSTTEPFPPPGTNQGAPFNQPHDQYDGSASMGGMAGAMMDPQGMAGDPYAKMDQQFNYQHPPQQQAAFFPHHGQHDPQNGQPMHFPTPASTRDSSPHVYNGDHHQNAYQNMHSLIHPAGKFHTSS